MTCLAKKQSQWHSGIYYMAKHYYRLSAFILGKDWVLKFTVYYRGWHTAPCAVVSQQLAPGVSSCSCNPQYSVLFTIFHKLLLVSQDIALIWHYQRSQSEIHLTRPDIKEISAQFLHVSSVNAILLATVQTDLSRRLTCYNWNYSNCEVAFAS